MMETLRELPPRPADVSALEFVRILTPYIFAGPAVCGRPILDIGCGCGHGTWFLASSNAGQRTVSIDINPESIATVSRMCADVPGFEAHVMDAQKITFEERSFERITCFEVIEHLPDPHALLERLRIVLTNDGVLLISTPNRARRLLPFQRTTNEEHLQEYRLGEFRRLLKRSFPAVTVLGIYGRPDLHDFYVGCWRPNASQFYLAWFSQLLQRVKSMIPQRIKSALRSTLGTKPRATAPVPGTTVPDIAVPQPVPAEWPFYLKDADRGCLNFVAVCGFDAVLVASTAGAIKNIHLLEGTHGR